MHVGGVYLFSLPDGADEQEYLHDLLANLRRPDEYRRPFGHRLKTSALGAALPSYWVADDKLDTIAAALDLTTSPFEHTGIQSVARRVISRAYGEL